MNPRFLQAIQHKIQKLGAAHETVKAWQDAGDQVVFTNGCFDLLHYGHIHYLAEAASLGQRLVVGLNSDASIKRLKGPTRPIQTADSRLYVVAALASVDLVVLFEEDTPLALIQTLQPDVLVKGGDWKVADIVGSESVLAKGGQVHSLDFVTGYSTTNIERKILSKQ